MKRDVEIRQAAIEHDWGFVFDDIFAEGAEWSDQHPSEETIKRVIELYKRWFSEQLDGSVVEFVRENWSDERASSGRKQK